MNYTNGVEGKGWYGFDLDGTLAVYDKWKGIDHIGAPVKSMVERMRKMHDEGKVVKILTARVAPRGNAEYISRERCTPPDYVAKADLFDLPPDGETWIENMYLGLDTWGAREFIVDWCLKNLGFLPYITHEKDHLMLMLFDDRVKQVVPNEGLLVEDLYGQAVSELTKAHADKGWLLAKLESKCNGFTAGLLLGVVLVLATQFGVELYRRCFGPERPPAQVRIEKAHAVLCDLLNDWPEEAK